MNTLLALSRAIDAVNRRVGRAVTWLILLAVLVSATNATVRKLFNVSSNAWLELQWYLFGAVFLLVLFIGFCLALGFVKLRPSGPKTLTVRSLEEALGQPVSYLTPEAPRGTTDQLGGSGRAA